MKGSLQKKGKYYYAVIYMRNERGENKPKWFKTKCTKKADAENYLVDLLHNIQHGTFIDPSKILFVDFLEDWFDNTISGQVQQTTLEGYETCIKRHIIPFFKPLNLKLQELKPIQLQDYFTKNYKDGRLDGKGGLSANTLRRHYANLKKALDYVVKMELIERNPIYRIELPKIVPFKAKFLTIDEAKILLEAVKGTSIETAVYLAVSYGFRRGELLGLRWKDINFKDDFLTIQNTRTRVRKAIEKCPKTRSSTRQLDLIPNVKSYLKNLMIKQKEDRLLTGSKYVINDYICKDENGKPLDITYLNHAFKKIIKESKLPDIRFHDLRHSTASYLNYLGYGIKEIQKWLGHSNSSTTLNMYVHLFRESSKEIANGMNNIFGDLKM